ncbi:hypothetical protein D3C71_2053790 [compost metagenome]
MGQDRRIDDDHVGGGKKGRQPGKDFGADGRTEFRNLEIAIEQAGEPGGLRCAGGRLHGLGLVVHFVPLFLK